MALCDYDANALEDMAQQLLEFSQLLSKESERLKKCGPKAVVSVNYQLTEKSPLLKGMLAITQFVGAIVAAGGHATIANMASQQATSKSTKRDRAGKNE